MQLASRIRKLESANPTPTEPPRVHRVIFREPVPDRQAEIARQLAGTDYDPARDLVICRTIVRPPALHAR